MEQFKIELGATVTDRISGFKGIVTGRCDYTTGCNRYQVQPPAKADGGWTESVWLDEHLLTVGIELKLCVQPPSVGKAGAYGSDPR